MKRFALAPLAWIAVLALAGALPAAAQPIDDFSGTATADLSGFNEVPAIFTFGGGRFEATVNADGTEIEWDLTYDHLTANVTQAHIHFAEQRVNGAIVIFFCSNLPNPPAGTPACPAPPAHLTGTFTAANVGAGAAAQGIGAQQIKALLRAMRAGATYVNVHSTKFPGGEIRGQVRFDPTP